MSRRRFRVIRATTNPIPSVQLDPNHGVEFKPNGSDVVVDEGVARELEAAYGPKGNERPGQVVVVPIDAKRAGKLFTFPVMPWKRGQNDDLS